MGVQNLTQDNFSLNDGRLLCDMTGICIVMFKSNGCKFSNQFFPIYTKLSSRESRLTWATVNIDGNRNIVNMSKGTKTQINAVPIIIMYVNGRPFAKYSGDLSGEKLMDFVNKILDKVGVSNNNNSTPGFTPTINTPQVMVTQGSPIDSQPNLPNNSNGIVKTPHNAPYLAYLN